METLDALKQRLSSLSEQTQTQPQPVWDRMNTSYSKMSLDQAQFAFSHEKVIAAKELMVATFNDWLFEKFKNDFASVPACCQVAESYVDAFVSAASEFASSIKDMNSENISLKKELEELRAQLNGRQEEAMI